MQKSCRRKSPFEPGRLGYLLFSAGGSSHCSAVSAHNGRVECETGTQTDGSLVVLAVAVASRLQLPPPAAPTGADMPPAGGPLRPRDCADTRSAGDAQGPAAVAQAQRRRRGQGLPRPRSRAEQVLLGTARCCKLSVPRNCPHQLWTTRLVFATKCGD